MNMIFETPSRLRVELDRRDMAELNITYSSLDYTDSHSRRVLHELLSRIGAADAFDGKGKRTLIEIYPRDGGGCVIYFTALAQSGQESSMRRLILEPTVYSLDTAEDVLSAIEAIAREGRKPTLCKVYLSADGYRVVIACTSAEQRCLDILAEFGQVVGRGNRAAAHEQEHSQLISADAVYEIGRLL